MHEHGVRFKSYQRYTKKAWSLSYPCPLVTTHSLPQRQLPLPKIVSRYLHILSNTNGSLLCTQLCPLPLLSHTSHRSRAIAFRFLKQLHGIPLVGASWYKSTSSIDGHLDKALGVPLSLYGISEIPSIGKKPVLLDPGKAFPEITE